MWIVSPPTHLVLHHYQIPPRCKAGGHTGSVQQKHSTPKSNPLHMLGIHQSQIKHIWGTHYSGVLKFNNHTITLKNEELLWDFPILTFSQAWELNSLKVLMILGTLKPSGHCLHLNNQLLLSPLQSSLLPLCTFPFSFPSLQLPFIFSFNHSEEARQRWRKYLSSKGR